MVGRRRTALRLGCRVAKDLDRLIRLDAFYKTPNAYDKDAQSVITSEPEIVSRPSSFWFFSMVNVVILVSRATLLGQGVPGVVLPLVA